MMLDEQGRIMGDWPATGNTEVLPMDRQEGLPGATCSWAWFLGLRLDFLSWLWFSSKFFCILNTNGKEDLNQLECWAETNR